MNIVNVGSMHMNSWIPFGLGVGVLGIITMIVIVIAMIGIIFLKGYSLWYAAKRNEKWWFIIMLLINSIGILELIYLTFVVKRWSKNNNAPVQQ